jgi:hypothetical protein
MTHMHLDQQPIQRPIAAHVDEGRSLQGQQLFAQALAQISSVALQDLIRADDLFLRHAVGVGCQVELVRALQIGREGARLALIELHGQHIEGAVLGVGPGADGAHSAHREIQVGEDDGLPHLVGVLGLIDGASGQLPADALILAAEACLYHRLNKIGFQRWPLPALQKFLQVLDVILPKLKFCGPIGMILTGTIGH